MAYIPYPKESRFQANILRIHSWNAPQADAHHTFYRNLMFGPSPLSRVEREATAVAVSQANACHY